MELTFYCPSDLSIPFSDDRNRLIEAVPGQLDELERRGAKVRRIDPGTLDAEQFRHAYAEAVIPAVYKKYEVKRMFGTNRHSACFFGREVPALVVKQASDPIGDTYPHRESGTIVVTIHEFLTGALITPPHQKGSAQTKSGPNSKLAIRE